MYATDIAKMIEVPIFHVNGDDPIAVRFVSLLALDFRQEFGRDVVIDMYCYRRYGHNEGDEPAFAKRISAPGRYPSVAALARFDETSVFGRDERSLTRNRVRDSSGDGLAAGQGPRKRENRRSGPLSRIDRGVSAGIRSSSTSTAISRKMLGQIVDALTHVPDDFNVQPKIKRIILEHRRKVFENGGPFEWHYAEALAFGSLLLEKIPVRLSGQDSARGTFSTRHAVLYDGKTGAPYVPLMHMGGEQERICITTASSRVCVVLGFDYGYSLNFPHLLCLWEAQFGDFANGAQTIIDQFIVSAESKWQRPSGIVLLLPHGYEGQGPEHSSARLERLPPGLRGRQHPGLQRDYGRPIFSCSPASDETGLY